MNQMLTRRPLSALTLCLSLAACGEAPPEAAGGFTAQSAATSASGGFTAPLDTAPSSDGAVFYFTATAVDGRPAVFKVPAAGGAATQIAAGAPLTLPSGIAVSGDDQQLYIADTSAGVLRMATSGGALTALAGTSAAHPRGLDVARRDGADVVYFTGSDPASGAGAVFTVPGGGGAVVTLAQGQPLAAPVGIAVAAGGEVYVANPPAFGRGAGAGSVLKIAGGTTSSVAEGLPLGYPAGLALDHRGATLFVSGLDATRSHAAVYAVDLATRAVTTYSQGIAQNSGAGGVHRAATRDILGWCGITADTRGTVYQITFR